MSNINTIDPSQIGESVGGFFLAEDSDYAIQLKGIEDEFLGERMDIMKDFGDIISSESLREMYTERLLKPTLFEESLMMNPEMKSSLMEKAGAFNMEYLKSHDTTIKQIFENSCEHILSEALAVSSLNPFVGLTGPLITRSWTECLYKDIISVETATKPVYNQQFERAYIEDDKGKHYFPECINDLTKASAIWSGIERPVVGTAIDVPVQNYDIIANTPNASRDQLDALDMNVGIGVLLVEVDKEGGTKEIKEVPVEVIGSMEWGSFFKEVEITDNTTAANKVKVQISGHINRNEGTISIFGSPNVKKVKLVGNLSSENNMKTASVGWERSSRQFVIPTKPHLNTGLTKEMIQNQRALHGIDAVSKTVNLMTMAIQNFKDAECHQFINKQYELYKNTPFFNQIVDGEQFVISSVFDCKPHAAWTQTPEQWCQDRIVNKLEKMAVELKDILKIEDLYFKIIGNPRDIRIFDQHINWIAGDNSPNAKMNGVKLNYSFGIMTKMNKFQVVSSSRIPKGSGIRMLAFSTDKQYKTFTHYEYAFFLENDYRNPKNSNIPSVMATSMHTQDTVFPIQGHITIKNNNLDDYVDIQ